MLANLFSKASLSGSGMFIFYIHGCQRMMMTRAIQLDLTSGTYLEVGIGIAHHVCFPYCDDSLLGHGPTHGFENEPVWFDGRRTMGYE